MDTEIYFSINSWLLLQTGNYMGLIVIGMGFQLLVIWSSTCLQREIADSKINPN